MIHFFILVGMFLVWVIGGCISGLWSVHEKYADMEAPPVTDYHGFCEEMREKNLNERQIKLLERSGKYYRPEKIYLPRLFSMSEKDAAFYHEKGWKTEKVTYINNSMTKPLCAEFRKRKYAMASIEDGVKMHEDMFKYGGKATEVENGGVFECPRWNFTAKFEYDDYRGEGLA